VLIFGGIGHGTRIAIRLAVPTRAAAMRPEGTEAPRIMFVTDDDIGIAAAQRMLVARGYDVVRIERDDAAGRCGEQRVDLLVTSSGGAQREVIEEVRRKSGRIPVLLLAAQASSVDATVPGIAGTMVGPVAPEQLDKAVRVTCPREPVGNDASRR
jgi:DNA-binding response OmpR family regulator